MNRVRFILLVILCSLAACELVEYNPNEIVLKSDEKNLNEKAIRDIQQRHAGGAVDTVSFILMGDSQRFYDEVERFVESANNLTEPYDFVIHAGDIADFGLVDEFRWVHKYMNDLKVPYLAVVGNHDVLANGPRIYQEMYGDFDFTFEWGNYKFIFFNSNSREYAFNGTVPDIGWLAEEIDSTPESMHIILISHVPPWDGDFDPELEETYANLLASNANVRISLHGHQHNYLDSVYYNDGTRYFVTTSMNKRGYSLVKLWDEGIEIKRISF